MQQQKHSSEVLAGLLFLGFGGLFAGIASQYQLGSATNMGPGYFPLVLALLLSLIGLAQIVRHFDWVALQHAIVQLPKRIHITQLRTFGLVIASVALFGLFAESVGFVIATLLLIGVSGLAYQQAKIKELIILAPSLTLISVLVFSYGLDLPLPLLPLAG